jgi:hypothetical protein
MQTLRYLSGTLLVISGFWHGVLGFKTTENRPMLAFAVAYLVLGLLLIFRKTRLVNIGTLIIPLAGFLAASIKIGWSNFDFSLYTFVVIDLIVILCSIILLMKYKK